MESMESEQELRARARKRAEEKLGFYGHLGIYIVINTGLWLLWWITNREVFPWPAFVSLFWGIGLAAHGVGTFLSHSYADRMTEREYQKIKGNR